MKRKILKGILPVFLTIILMDACKKDDYIKGGTPEDTGRYKNTTTYDVLKSIDLYDTLVQLIDAAGIKDKVNESGTTFFAPNDFSIYRYMNSRTIELQNAEPTAKFALDSLIYYLKNNVNGTRDSMLMYLIKKPLTYDVLTNTGALYETELAGDTVGVSYEYTKDDLLGYNPLVSSVPQIVYFTQLWYPYTVSASTPIGDVPEDVGVRTLCKTSGILTQNGVLNALDMSHTLFFYGTKQ